MAKYAIGLDYGTLSARAILVDIETGETIAQLTAYEPEEMAFVGDRLYTDVATGVRNGAKGFLVLTGEATMKTVEESDVEPTCIYESLDEMRKYL